MYSEIREYIEETVKTYTDNKYRLDIFSIEEQILNDVTEYYKTSFNVPVTIMPYTMNIILSQPINKGRIEETVLRREFENTFITSDEIGVPASTGDIITIDRAVSQDPTVAKVSQEVIMTLNSFQHGKDKDYYRAGIEITFAHIIYPRYS